MRLIENIKSIIRSIGRGIKSIIRSIGRGIKALTAVDYPDGEEMDIGKSNDPKMTELKDSLNRVNALERSFYVSSSSTPKGGKGNSNIVDKVNVDSNKAIRRVDENARTEQKETSEQQVER